MLKHLQHCIGHRPQQLPQQQQHKPVPSPTFTISHQYSSLGGAVKRYNIDMQETQHLNHLSPTLRLPLPTMKTFRTKHHAYKFQVAITIVCHKEVDPSVVTQPPVNLTSEMIAVYAGIRIERIGVGKDLQLTLWQLDPLRGSAYIPLPRWIQTRRAVVNATGTGDDFSSLPFPTPIQSIGPLALRNNMPINVYGVDDDKEVMRDPSKNTFHAALHTRW